MADPAKRLATYDDVLAAPEPQIAQIIDGELVLQPRPSSAHASSSSILGMEIGPPFHRGKGGPGGWVILDEPELHLGADVLVPDLAGWTRTRMPELPMAAFFTLAPDWVCEVLSPSTARIDRVRKSRIYARERITHLWFLDPDARTLEVWRIDGDSYRVVLTAEDADVVQAEPFDAIELDLAVLWMR